jgi:hypothetical protein
MQKSCSLSDLWWRVEGLETDCGAFPLEITRAEPLSTPALFSVVLWALPPATAAFGGSMSILETKHMSASPQAGIQKGDFSGIRRHQQGTPTQQQPSLMQNMITFARQFCRVAHTCRYTKHLAGRQSITAPMLRAASYLWRTTRPATTSYNLYNLGLVPHDQPLDKTRKGAIYKC